MIKKFQRKIIKQIDFYFFVIIVVGVVVFDNNVDNINESVVFIVEDCEFVVVLIVATNDDVLLSLNVVNSIVLSLSKTSVLLWNFIVDIAMEVFVSV